ncbi:hypothetical protein ACJX0J_025691, partial [Zea mays]
FQTPLANTKSVPLQRFKQSALIRIDQRLFDASTALRTVVFNLSRDLVKHTFDVTRTTPQPI